MLAYHEALGKLSLRGHFARMENRLMERLPLVWTPPRPRGRSAKPAPLEDLDAGIARVLSTHWSEPDQRGVRAFLPDSDLMMSPAVRWLAERLEAAVASAEIAVTFGRRFVIHMEDGAWFPLAENFEPKSERAAALLRWREALQRGRPISACEHCGDLFAHGSRPGPRFCSQAHAVASHSPKRAKGG